LVTGAVNYALERRREHESAKVALRLLEVELAIAAATADSVLVDGRWSRWNFARAHRAWDEYRADAARVLSIADWIKLTVAFYGIELVEHSMAELGPGTELVPTGLKLVGQTRRDLYAAANALRQQLGMDAIRPAPETVEATSER
jgi:hypothetical protein